MSLVTIAEVEALVPSGVDALSLQTVIDRVEAEITEKIGAEYVVDLEITETLEGGCEHVFVKRPISAIVSVTDYQNLTDSSGTALTAAQTYHAWNDRGQITRLGGSNFGQKVIVIYTPKDQRDKRKAVIIDLVRLELSRTALTNERVANEYEYTAPKNWDAEKRNIMRRITLNRF